MKHQFYETSKILETMVFTLLILNQFVYAHAYTLSSHILVFLAYSSLDSNIFFIFNTRTVFTLKFQFHHKKISRI